MATNSVTMQDEMPMPPSQGWMVFHTPSAPNRIRWPMPSSMRNSGMPSRINMIMNGIRKAPAGEANTNVNEQSRDFVSHHVGMTQLPQQQFG